MNTALPRFRILASAACLLGLLVTGVHAVTITDDFSSYTASDTTVTGLTSSPGFGTANGGWLQGWRSASSSTAAVAKVLDTSHVKSGGNYFEGTLTSGASTGALDGIALQKAYDVTGNSLAIATALYYSFDIRVDSISSNLRFDIFDNQVRASGASGSTTSWQIRASGGVWYVINGTNVTSTTMSFTAGTTYSVSIVSDPTTLTWSYSISDGSTSVSGSSLGYRASSFAVDSASGSVGGRWLAFAAAENVDTASQSATFSLDNVYIGTTSSIPEPATYALLSGLVLLGLAAVRRSR